MSKQPTPVATAHITAPYGPLADALKLAELGTACATAPAQHGVLIEADDTDLTLRTHDWETAVPSPSPPRPSPSPEPLCSRSPSSPSP
ncbi:hypothetical protein [Streptomyces badius]|uniref:Uncharacterized protein n=1 Tax=Streptomyces badius TaxID=1941 RepID=A0ABQ2TQ38_STRBA|nr:hypothetical protein [Streptomyces badius]GGS80207.1 hypothetical protein GCM10010253_63740 [Streptomyces badius]